jgi:hypothetical protein
MKLPKRGLMAHEDGQIVWAWEHNDPDRDFDVLPPFVSTLDGEDMQSLATPGSTVIDLEDVGLGRGDIHLLHTTLNASRLRKRADGSWALTHVIAGETEKDEPLEVDHPLIDTINARRARRGQPLLKKGVP